MLSLTEYFTYLKTKTTAPNLRARGLEKRDFGDEGAEGDVTKNEKSDR